MLVGTIKNKSRQRMINKNYTVDTKNKWPNNKYYD